MHLWFIPLSNELNSKRVISMYNLCIAGYQMSRHSISTFTKVENGIYIMWQKSINIQYLILFVSES